jgi:hypothetical protein
VYYPEVKQGWVLSAMMGRCWEHPAPICRYNEVNDSSFRKANEDGSALGQLIAMSQIFEEDELERSQSRGEETW